MKVECAGGGHDSGDLNDKLSLKRHNYKIVVKKHNHRPPQIY